jgi:hypothetical protein
LKQSHKLTRSVLLEKVINELAEKEKSDLNVMPLPILLFDAVVSILTDDGRTIRGTGFLVHYQHKNLVITCAHVLHAMKKNKDNEILLGLKDGKQQYKARIIYELPTAENIEDLSAEDEIAILLLSDVPKGIWYWKEETTEVGTSCTVFGFGKSGGKVGMNVHLKIGAGLAEQFRQLDRSDDNPYVEMEVGMSGSPIPTADGQRLIGMLSGLNTRMGSTTYGDFIPASLIERKIKLITQLT